jgi:hypothetical protein
MAKKTRWRVTGESAQPHQRHLSQGSHSTSRRDIFAFLSFNLASTGKCIRVCVHVHIGPRLFVDSAGGYFRSSHVCIHTQTCTYATHRDTTKVCTLTHCMYWELWLNNSRGKEGVGREGRGGSTMEGIRMEHTHRADDDNLLDITFKQRNKVCHGKIKEMWWARHSRQQQSPQAIRRPAAAGIQPSRGGWLHYGMEMEKKLGRPELFQRRTLKDPVAAWIEGREGGSLRVGGREREKVSQTSLETWAWDQQLYSKWKCGKLNKKISLEAEKLPLQYNNNLQTSVYKKLSKTDWILGKEPHNCWQPSSTPPGVPTIDHQASAKSWLHARALLHTSNKLYQSRHLPWLHTQDSQTRKRWDSRQTDITVRCWGKRHASWEHKNCPREIGLSDKDKF